MKYILEDIYEHDERKGQPKYFKDMTQLGPMATPNIEEAFKFDTEEEAKQSQANLHWSSSWTVSELPAPSPDKASK